MVEQLTNHPSNTPDVKLADNSRFPLKEFLAGASAYSIFAWFYDYPLYMFVIGYLGPIWGGITMTLLTIPVDLLSLRLYDWSKKDWLALEYLRSHREYSGANRIKKLIKLLLTKTPKLVQATVLSIKFNAFIITALLREGADNKLQLSRRDWVLFWWSFLVSQLYWVLVIWLGLETAEFIFF
jgi:hypothetical protein